MKDERVKSFRAALDGLIESLDATIRVTRWDGDDALPEPLKESASRLVQRLGAADRLAAAIFKGSPADVVRVTAMAEAMRRLDAAYVAYRRHLEGKPAAIDVAALALHAEIDEVRAAAHRWS